MVPHGNMSNMSQTLSRYDFIATLLTKAFPSQSRAASSNNTTFFVSILTKFSLILSTSLKTPHRQRQGRSNHANHKYKEASAEHKHARQASVAGAANEASTRSIDDEIMGG